MASVITSIGTLLKGLAKRFGNIFKIRRSRGSKVKPNRVYSCVYRTLPDNRHHGEIVEAILFLAVTFERGLHFVSSKKRSLIGCLRIDNSKTSDQLIGDTISDLVNTNKTVSYEAVRAAFGTRNVRTLIKNRMIQVIEVDVDTLKLKEALDKDKESKQV